jgi:hypothetical protein
LLRFSVGDGDGVVFLELGLEAGLKLSGVRLLGGIYGKIQVDFKLCSFISMVAKQRHSSKMKMK